MFLFDFYVGFESGASFFVDKRFDDVNKRFDDVNRNFGRMFAFLTTFFIVAGTLLALPYFQG